MSWKKLLKSAKRLEMPLIIADQDGNDPFVIMPLDHYEMLVTNDFEDVEDENFDPLEFIPEASEMRQSEPDERAIGAFEMIDEMDSGRRDLAQDGEKIKSEVVESYTEPVNSPVDKEISLEDRFYFEPLEDQGKK